MIEQLIGNNYNKINNCANALKHYERSLEILRRVHGPYHSDIVRNLDYIIAMHYRMENNELALLRFNESRVVQMTIENCTGMCTTYVLVYLPLHMLYLVMRFTQYVIIYVVISELSPLCIQYAICIRVYIYCIFTCLFINIDLVPLYSCTHSIYIYSCFTFMYALHLYLRYVYININAYILVFILLTHFMPKPYILIRTCTHVPIHLL